MKKYNLTDLEKVRQYRDLKLDAKEGDDAMVVEGYATTYNQPYILWTERDVDKNGKEYTIGIYEQVDRKAFDDADMADVIFQFNHEGKVYARLSNKTMELDKDDEHGLKVTAYLGGTDIGRQLYQEINGGYINKMSFGFTIKQMTDLEEFDDGEFDENYIYTIEQIGKLYDVSAVSLPQNDFTSISAREFNDGAISEFVTERLQAHREKVERAKKVEMLKKLIEED